MIVLFPLSALSVLVIVIYLMARGYGRAITSPNARPLPVVLSLLFGAFVASQVYHAMHKSSAPTHHRFEERIYLSDNDADYLEKNPGTVTEIFHNSDVARRFGLRVDSNGLLIK